MESKLYARVRRSTFIPFEPPLHTQTMFVLMLVIAALVIGTAVLVLL